MPGWESLGADNCHQLTVSKQENKNFRLITAKRWILEAI